MSDSEHEVEKVEKEATDVSDLVVVEKYQTAGRIVRKALKKVIRKAVVDANTADLCVIADQYMMEQLSKVYTEKVKGKRMEKGIAFPTCVSVNEIVGHASPMAGDGRVLKAGDVAKIDLAVHIDGFIASAAHTVVIGEEKVEDPKKADVIMAAWNAAQAALRLVKPGNKNTQVTEAIRKVANDFGVVPVKGVLSHQMKKHVIDGNRVIINHETDEERVAEFEFEIDEVYCIDIVMSTGNGKAQPADSRSTIFKRNVDNNVQLKMQKSRQFIGEVTKKYPALPFSLRWFADPMVGKVGTSESKKHDMVYEYPVLTEKPGAIVAQFKFTLLLIPDDIKRIGNVHVSDMASKVVSSKTIQDEEVAALLKTEFAEKLEPESESEESAPESDPDFA